MNIRINPVHINTLFKLKELAEKHNCVIYCGVNNFTDKDVDWTILEKSYENKNITKELSELYLENECSVSTSYYYTLYDKNNNTYHSLTYTEAEVSFRYDDDIWYIDKEALEWLKENSPCSNIMIYSTNYQTIQGFNNVDKKKIYVYREGMLIKFFGDLVCDYLGEERIQEVY